MTYIRPEVFTIKVIDAGEAKVHMEPSVVLVRAFMAGAVLAVAAAFAITVGVQTGYPILGAILFPVGFCLLILMGYDLLTGVFVLVPLAYLDQRHGVTLSKMFKNWGLVFVGNFAGAFMIACMTAVVFTYGFSTKPTVVGEMIANIGEARTVGYKEHGAGGMLTIFIRGVLCNWMVSMGVIGAMVSTSVSGKIMVMWMPIMLFFAMTFEHSIVNMYLFPTALLIGGDFSIVDYLIWNEIPVVIGNLVGGMLLTGLPLYLAHVKCGKRVSIKTENVSGKN